MQESEPQSEKKVSPEQADAFAAELAPGWATDEHQIEATPHEAAAANEIPAPEAQPAQLAEPDEDAPTIKAVSPPAATGPASPPPGPEPVALAAKETHISIQQPETATQPKQAAPREVEVRQMRKAAAAPATVQVRAPEYETATEPPRGRVLVNLALVVLGIGVGIASVMVYLQFRENRRPQNTNKGFETEIATTAEKTAQSDQSQTQPTTAREGFSTSKGVDPATMESATTERHTAEGEAVAKPDPTTDFVEQGILLRLKTTPPDATVTVNGEPFANPFEGEVAHGGEHLFVVSAPGYLTERLRVRFDSDRRVQMDLEPAQPRAAIRPRKRVRSMKKRTSSKQTAATKPTRRKPATFVTDNPY